MDSKVSNRRRFLTQTAALAGVAAGAGLLVKGQPASAHRSTSIPSRRAGGPDTASIT